MTVDTLIVSPGRRHGYALVGLAVVLAAVAVGSDAAGRLLTAPAAVVALVLAVRELRGGPVLRADGHGIALRQGWRRVEAPWGDVERMRVVKDRRTTLLEVDIGQTVVLLSQLRLGRLPADVLDDLMAVRGLTR